ncbi:hypothetical protein [Rhodococcus sp. NPDC058521]|uniref:hypothetical protein n=1 Tax=Rhodococcus sp. NPDC058521 TaxID=3346536 RepID=UPI00364E7E3F
MSTPIKAVTAGLDGIRSWQEEFYKDPHANPELPHQERRTAGKVAEKLQPTLAIGTRSLVVASMAWLAGDHE